jgi:spoIIIJ-associated protein
MSDLVFSGTTVDEAVTLAGETLGLPPARVRYVVLQDAVPGSGRTAPSPAKIVVLVEAPQRPGTQAPPTSSTHVPEEAPRPLDETLTALAAAFSKAAEEETTFTVVEQGERVTIEMGSPNGPAVWDRDAVLLEALELLLRRVAGVDGRARRVHVFADGQGDRRETALRQSALATAEAVLADGASRPLEHLNSFERRIVHMTLAAVPGVRTRSEGDGAERRLWIETAPAPDA